MKTDSMNTILGLRIDRTPDAWGRDREMLRVRPKYIGAHLAFPEHHEKNPYPETVSFRQTANTCETRRRR